MKRSPLSRKTPLRAKSRPVRKTRIRPVNTARKRKRFAENFGDYAESIRAMSCVVPGCSDPSEAAHFKSRGAGGNRRYLFPCCTAHHREQHDLGILTWQAKYGLDLEAITAHLWATKGETR